MKYVYEKVSSCEHCPWLRGYSEEPGRRCGCPYVDTKVKYKGLYSEEHPYANFKIPEWCPLPEEES